MKQYKKILSLAATLIFSTACIAGPQDIPLESVAVLPRETASISLKPVKSYLPYTVYCTLSSNAKSGQNEDILQAQFSYRYSFYINGVANGGYNLGVFKISTSKPTILTVELVFDDYARTPLKFLNTDDTDTITIFNCYAHRKD